MTSPMQKTFSEIFLPNYWDILQDGIGSKLKRSRKMFLRGRLVTLFR